MNNSIEAFVQSSSFTFLLISSLLIHPSTSSTTNFVYGGCTQLKFTPGTPYESNVDSVLTSVVNSAATANFNNFKISLPGSTQSDVVYGLYQCRGDLSNDDCHDCIVHAVSQLGGICADTSGGALQLDGCFVKYDNISFLGVEDKTVVMKKCGPSIGYNSDSLTRRDAVLGYLTAGGQYFRVGGSGNVQGIVQCVQDLSMGQCQDCVSEAIGRLKNECGTSPWGDMFLAKCYARYSESGYHSGSDNSNDMEKTLAIIVGLIAGVALIIVLLSALNKLFEKKGGK
ncbi:plasmodesmata-located protein 6-like [Coffea arabica]|uniref:Plasmodesmata-located protein 6-like n=1 Tax=Coffea arabica TaxID=13443 RepID=A0A6P6V6Z6_COFAR|nr:cysteine-rich repeat secretory protein 12-like [Coffea arabica]